MKKELEEAAARHFNKEDLVEGVNIQYVLQCAFIEGAKWQQEQDKNKYSKEEVQDILRKSHSIKKLHEWFLDY